VLEAAAASDANGQSAKSTNSHSAILPTTKDDLSIPVDLRALTSVSQAAMPNGVSCQRKHQIEDASPELILVPVGSSAR